MKSGFLSTLTAEQLSRVRNESSTREFLPGSAISTPDDSVVVIVAGRVSCEVTDLAGNPFAFASGGAGEVFGELGLYSAEIPNDEKVTIKAETPVSGIQLSAEVFREIVTTNPRALEFLLRQNVARLLNMNRFAFNAVQIGADPERQSATKLSERMADLITKHIGTWNCVAAFVVFIIVWMAGNAVLSRFSLDPYPYIFLNLILSSVSALTMPVILMSQNRQSQADRHAFRATQQLIKTLEKELSLLKDRASR